MSISKAYKFRIYPTENQKDIIDECFRVSNFIYNYFLGLEIETTDVLKMYGLRNNDTSKEINEWKTEHKLWFNRFDASRHLTKLSKGDKYPFLNILPANSRTYALKSLENAFDKVKKKQGNFPKFKNKYSSKSYTIQTQKPLNIQHIKGKRYLINIPSARNYPLTEVDIVIHNKEFFNRLKCNSCTISKTSSGQYYISFQCELNGEVPEKKAIKPETSIGVDRGIRRPIVLSDKSIDIEILNKKIEFLKSSQEELVRLQRILSKKKRGSNKYNSIKNKISKLHTKIKNQRSWVQHNISKALTNIDGVDTIIIEDLKIANMTKSPKPKKGENGHYEKNGKKSKSNINKGMLDVGHHEIKIQLQYKGEWNGVNIVFVDPKYTSQKCNECGHIDKDNRPKGGVKFKCVNCGHTDDADDNAAKNIKDKYFEKNQ